MVRAIADEQPLASRVHFLGSRSDVPQLLNECQLLVHAARQEPLGRVLLEAAASGLAVVATDVGGTREIFPRQADAAILVPADNRSALADATFSILTHESRRAQLGRAARKQIESRFDIRDSAARLIDQYHAVLT